MSEVSGEIVVPMWKVLGLGDWAYFESNEVDALVAGLTEAAIHYEYNRSTAGSAHYKRRRLRAWFMRGRGNSYDDERAAGLHRSNGRPQVYALVDGEWVEVDWRLVEPTVVIETSLSGSSAGVDQ